MKTTKKIFLTLAIAIFGVLAGRTTALGDPLYTPRARAFFDSVRIVPGSTEDKLDRSAKAVSPKSADLIASLRVAPGRTDDKVDRTVKAVPPKAFDVLNSLGGGATSVAPVK